MSSSKITFLLQLTDSVLKLAQEALTSTEDTKKSIVENALHQITHLVSVASSEHSIAASSNWQPQFISLENIHL